ARSAAMEGDKPRPVAAPAVADPRAVAGGHRARPVGRPPRTPGHAARPGMAACSFTRPVRPLALAWQVKQAGVPDSRLAGDCPARSSGPGPAALIFRANRAAR